MTKGHGAGQGSVNRRRWPTLQASMNPSLSQTVSVTLNEPRQPPRTIDVTTLHVPAAPAWAGTLLPSGADACLVPANLPAAVQVFGNGTALYIATDDANRATWEPMIRAFPKVRPAQCRPCSSEGQTVACGT